MRLVLAIVNTRDIRSLREALVESDYRFTELGSTGGFLRQGNVTLLIGVETDRLEALLELLAERCRRREVVLSVSGADTRVHGDTPGEPQVVSVGGAQVFVLAVERAVTLD